MMKDVSRLNIDRIAFIGRTHFEYVRMFGLDESFFQKGPVLDCAAGPSSFAAEASQAGFNVTACDLLYGISVDHLVKKGREDITHVFDKLDEVAHLYTWKHYRDKHEIIALRHMALDLFSQDLPAGLAEGRYVRAELPRLPFPDKAFSLVLSSHFLFLYGDRLDLDFHTSCLKELVRVSSGEVRIFPLQGLDANPYPHMDKVLSFLKAENIAAETVEVPFEFQKGSNRLMRLRRQY
ncbi:MAG: class I SAM-dependent methyltransferase [Betaproteobacteria bacterium]